MTASFATGALLLSMALALLTHGLASSYLVRQREASTVRQAAVNARLVQSALRQPGLPVLATLASLEGPAESDQVIAWNGGWASSSVEVGPKQLPDGLRQQVLDGRAGRQRFELDGESRLAVGVPLPEVRGAYFEVFSFAELEATLRTLLASVLAAGVVTTVAGALVGRWASRAALRPLTEASAAAAAIAGGRLDTRLPPDDASLAELAKSFNAMVDALQTRIQRDARFASDVGHELRSPLTTLAATTEVLAGRRHELSERGRRAVDLLSAEVAHFQRLVEDLLEISRADAGTLDLVLEEVRLAELAVRSGPVARARLRVAESPGAEGARVRVDKRRFEQVVANLVNNAVRHGGGVDRVAVEPAGDRPGRVRLVVEDRGPGVPEAERERVFERFSRGVGGGDRGLSEGAGLGLALVHEHVRVHGGTTWVEDREGGGARFVVELPSVPP